MARYISVIARYLCVFGTSGDDVIAQEEALLQDRVVSARAQLSELRVLHDHCGHAAINATQGTPLDALCVSVPQLWQREGGSGEPFATFGDTSVMTAKLPPSEAVAFVQLRNPRTEGKATTPALVVATAKENIVSLFSLEGEKLAEIEAPMKILRLVGSPSFDEPFVVATNSTHMTIFQVHMRIRKLTKAERDGRRESTEKTSQHLTIADSVNCTISYDKSYRVITTKKLTQERMIELATASYRGSKYFLASDTSGFVSIYSRNGTKRASLKIPGVVRFAASHALVAYQTSDDVGVLLPDQASTFACNLGVKPVAIAVDVTSVGRVWVTTRTVTHVLTVNKEKKTCVLEKESIPATFDDIYAYKQVFVGMRLGQKFLTAINITNIANFNTLWETTIDDDIHSALFFRKWQRGEIFALHGSEGVRIVNVYFSVHATSTGALDTINNMRTPVFLIALLCVLGWQYIKRGGREGGGYGRKRMMGSGKRGRGRF